METIYDYYQRTICLEKSVIYGFYSCKKTVKNKIHLNTKIHLHVTICKSQYLKEMLYNNLFAHFIF